LARNNRLPIRGGGNRRDIGFSSTGLSLRVSTSSSAPSDLDGITIREGGHVGIRSSWTGNYALFVNQRGEQGIAIHHQSSKSTWELQTASAGYLYLFSNAGGDIARGSFHPNTGIYTPVSDRKLKREIRPLDSSLSKVKNLKPSTYEMKSADNQQREMGFIAQEVQDYFPELVHENINDQTGESFYTLNYDGITVVAVKAIQEQQEIIEKLEERIEDLERKLEKMQRRGR